MTDKTQTIAIRLLRAGLAPADAVRAGVELADWGQFEGAKIATGPLGGGAPDWTDFLALSADQKEKLHQRFAYGLVFLETEGRWFAIAFGLGHSKLNPAAVEQDFGLRVVLNTVDHKKLRSADLRTPDANTVSRRSQTSRASDQAAFGIDAERDIVRGLLGEPRDQKFATKVSGGDALTLRRKLKLDDLPQVCADALKFYDAKDYQAAFGWIDQIKHVREPGIVAALDAKLVGALSDALKVNPADVDDVHLAYPSIYDPEKLGWVRFRGFRHTEIFPDLEIAHYLAALKARGIDEYKTEYLKDHSVQECDESGKTPGQSWCLSDCLVFETDHDGRRYVLSGGRWYEIDKTLAKEVSDFFSAATRVDLPEAKAGENEEKYNKRVANEAKEMVCLDAKTIKPSDAYSPIEACDFFSEKAAFVHIKDKTASSRLSHLFNQGVVSAVTFKRDGPFRAALKELVEAQPDGAKFSPLLPGMDDKVKPEDFTVIFGVLANAKAGKEPRLPFFSMVSFRQAARHIADELGFNVAFAWVRKGGAGAGKKPERAKKGGA
jgi:uncharacterized protein (TIGR04141 family)